MEIMVDHKLVKTIPKTQQNIKNKFCSSHILFTFVGGNDSGT